ncbi:MAG: hypothetical protein M0Z67_04725 [Nitrospiraceae bacterium]|nr:hypothetical protein [Nitrospiraceae bacterium]
MKACEVRGGANPFREKMTGKGVVADFKAFNYMTRKQEEKEAGGQRACPFSLEACCEQIDSEEKEGRHRICPFTLEAVGAASMAYCPAGS